MKITLTKHCYCTEDGKLNPHPDCETFRGKGTIETVVEKVISWRLTGEGE